MPASLALSSTRKLTLRVFCLLRRLFARFHSKIQLCSAHLTLPDGSFSILSLPQQQKNKCLLRWRLFFCCCGTLYHSSFVFTAFLKGAPGCYLPPAGFVCIKEMLITIQTCGEHLFYFFSALEYSNLNTAPFFD